MSNQLYHLQTQTIQQHGQFLLVGREPYLTRHDIVLHEEKMLQNYGVPRLLPLEFEEKDLSVTLRFDITSKRPLFQWLSSQKLTHADYGKLLYTILGILDDSKMYMLSEQRYVLDWNYVYADSSLTDVYLLYLPLKDLPGKPDIQQELVQLADRLVLHTKEGRNDRTQELLHFLKSERFSIPAAKKMLLEWLSDQTPIEHNTINQILESVKNNQVRNEITFSQKSPVPHKSQQPGGEANSETELLTLNSYIALASLISLSSVCWILYQSEQAEGWSTMGIGFTLLTVITAYMLLKTRRMNKGIPLPLTMNKTTKTSGTLINETVSKSVSPQSFKTPTVAPSQEPFRTGSSQEVSPTNYYSNLSQQTTLLSSIDATVFLGNMNQQVQNLGWIEREHNGEIEQLNVTETPLIIGRDQAAAQVVDETVGVSRTHAEVYANNQICFVKDLGSKNGTFLNNERLIPFKSYELQPDDKIRVVKTEYIYKKIG